LGCIMDQTSTHYRIETDSMGEVRVPSQALYGAQTQRAVENFTISRQTLPWSFIRAILFIKQAAARTNNELGLLPDTLSHAIADSVTELLADKPMEEFPVSVFQTGSGTSTNMNVNEVICGLARRRGIELSANDHVNLGQSSNDVIPSALQMASVIETEGQLLPALKLLTNEILQFARNNSDVIKTGRTHLMDALPIRLHAELEGWAAQISESCERLEDSLARLRKLPLGGTAVGSGVNCHPDFSDKAITRLNKKTSITFSLTSSFYKGISSLDTVVEHSGVLKTTGIALSKIANDLRWMNSGPLTGLSEIKLPALQPGSSIMPAKVNPVIPEAVCMAVAQVIGNDTTIHVAGLGGNFQLNTMLPVAAANILNSIDLLSGSALALAEKTIPKMKVNREIYSQSLALNPILVTSLNPIIGYNQAAKIGKIASEEKRPVIEVAKELTDIPHKDLERLLDPKTLADWDKQK
jgi:fumarate hydratase class II